MPKTKKQNTLHRLLITKLNVLLDVEMQLVKALPKMAQNASSTELQAAFEDHLAETEGHVEKVTECLQILDEKSRLLKSDAIRGLIKDAQWVIKNVQTGPALDAAMIAAAQYVEHYEMAGYGTACDWALLMKHTEVESILHVILEEEKAADSKLNDLAINTINAQVDMGMEEVV